MGNKKSKIVLKSMGHTQTTLFFENLDAEEKFEMIKQCIAEPLIPMVEIDSVPGQSIVIPRNVLINSIITLIP